MANEKNNNLQKYLEMQRKAEEEEKRERAEAAERARIAREAEEARKRKEREDALARERAIEEEKRKRERDAQAAEAIRIGREKERKRKKRLNALIVFIMILVAGLWVLQLVSIHTHALGVIRILAMAAFVVAIIAKFYLLYKCADQSRDMLMLGMLVLVVLQICLCWRVFAPAIYVDEETGIEYQYNEKKERVTIVGIEKGEKEVDASAFIEEKDADLVVLKKRFLKGSGVESFTLKFDGELRVAKKAFKRSDEISIVNLEAENITLEINSLDSLKADSVSVNARENLSVATQAFIDVNIEELLIGCEKTLSVEKHSFHNSKIENLCISDASVQLAKKTFNGCNIGTLTLKNAHVTAGSGSNSNEVLAAFGGCEPFTLRLSGGSLKYYSDATETLILSSDAELLACRYSATISSITIETVPIGTVVLAKDFAGSAQNYSSSGLIGTKNHQMPLGSVIYIPRTLSSIPANLLGDEGNAPTVYYEGTEAEWNRLSVASGNGNYSAAKVNFNATHEEWNP